MAKSKTKNLIGINFLYRFLDASLALLVPLYLVERGMDIAEVGTVLSILPLIMIFARTGLAIISDIIGTRFIFILASVSDILALIIYTFANVPSMFSFGKVLEGVAVSSFWAVNRTEIYRNADGRNEGNVASLMLSARTAANFLARIAIGFAIAFAGFFNTFLALFVVAGAFLLSSFKIRDYSKTASEKITLDALKKRICAKRKKEFWHAASLALFSAPLDVLVAFLFPLYLVSNFLMSAAEIGILIALYFLFYAIGVFFCTKYNLSVRRGSLLSFLLIVLPLLAMPYASHAIIYALISLIGFGSGFEGFVYEHLIARGVAFSKSVSTDIAIIHIPYKLTEVLFYILVGVLVQLFGFNIGFIAIAITSTIFSITTYLFFKSINR